MVAPCVCACVCLWRVVYASAQASLYFYKVSFKSIIAHAQFASTCLLNTKLALYEHMSKAKAQIYKARQVEGIHIPICTCALMLTHKSTHMPKQCSAHMFMFITC